MEETTEFDHLLLHLDDIKQLIADQKEDTINGIANTIALYLITNDYGIYKNSIEEITKFPIALRCPEMLFEATTFIIENLLEIDVVKDIVNRYVCYMFGIKSACCDAILYYIRHTNNEYCKQAYIKIVMQEITSIINHFYILMCELDNDPERDEKVMEYMGQCYHSVSNIVGNRCVLFVKINDFDKNKDDQFVKEIIDSAIQVAKILIISKDIEYDFRQIVYKKKLETEAQISAINYELNKKDALKNKENPFGMCFN